MPHPEIFLDHRVVEAWGVKRGYLNHKEKLLDATLEVAQRLGLITLESFIHQYQPTGLSLILVVSQSHLAVHTWPEFEYLHIDILSCSKNANLDDLERILQDKFQPEKILIRKIDY